MRSQTEQNFIEFLGECCEEVKESPEYIKYNKELEDAVDVISAKLNDDDKKLVKGANSLDDYITAVEAVVQEDYFKAGFLAGIRLSK